MDEQARGAPALGAQMAGMQMKVTITRAATGKQEEYILTVLEVEGAETDNEKKGVE